MRVLVNALAPTHLMPMVPLTWALRAAGHEVMFLGHADTVTTAHEAGLATRRIGPANGGAHRWRKPVRKNDPFSAPGSSTTVPNSDREKARTAAIAQQWAGRIDGYIDDYLEFARPWRPDLILSEPMEFSGSVAAAALGVPLAMHRFGVDNFTSTLVEPMREALQEVCDRLDAPGAVDPALVLDPCPAAVQSPNVPVGTPVRYVPYNGTAPIADWTLEEPHGRRICISFGLWGIQVLAAEKKLRDVVESIGAAVDELGDVEAIFLMPEQYADDLGRPPRGIRVVDQLPINLFMRDCDLMVHHGGNGIALTALACGVPQLIVAQEGPLYAPTGERIEAAGAGRAILDEKERFDPQVIGAAITDVLTGQGYAKAAEALCADIAALPTPAARVADLEALVG
jgi:UDP:flavonoid glycosyltransferase YjiC (YdhE family)